MKISKTNKNHKNTTWKENHSEGHSRIRNTHRTKAIATNRKVDQFASDTGRSNARLLSRKSRQRGNTDERIKKRAHVANKTHDSDVKQWRGPPGVAEDPFLASSLARFGNYPTGQRDARSGGPKLVSRNLCIGVYYPNKIFPISAELVSGLRKLNKSPETVISPDGKFYVRGWSFPEVIEESESEMWWIKGMIEYRHAADQMR